DVGYRYGAVDRVNLRSGQRDQRQRIAVGAYHERHTSAGTLKVRQIHRLPAAGAQRGLLDSGHDADNLTRLLFKADREALAQRVLIWPVLLGQRVINNDHARSILAVEVGELPSSQQTNLQRLKEIGSHDRVIRIGSFTSRPGSALDEHVGAFLGARQRQTEDGSRGSYPGRVIETIKHLLKESRLLHLVCVFRWGQRRQRDFHGQRLRWIEAGINISQAHEALGQKRRADHQDHGQRNFRHNQKTAQTVLAQTTGRSSRAFLERLIQINS